MEIEYIEPKAIKVPFTEEEEEFQVGYGGTESNLPIFDLEEDEILVK